MVYMWRSENKFWVSVLSFHCSFWGGHLASPSQLSLKPGTSTYQEIRGWDSGQGTIFLSLAWSFLVIFSLFFLLPTEICLSPYLTMFSFSRRWENGDNPRWTRVQSGRQAEDSVSGPFSDPGPERRGRWFWWAQLSVESSRWRRSLGSKRKPEDCNYLSQSEKIRKEEEIGRSHLFGCLSTQFTLFLVFRVVSRKKTNVWP